MVEVLPPPLLPSDVEDMAREKGGKGDGSFSVSVPQPFTIAKS